MSTYVLSYNYVHSIIAVMTPMAGFGVPGADVPLRQGSRY
jgi:hypothetical protein